LRELRDFGVVGYGVEDGRERQLRAVFHIIITLSYHTSLDTMSWCRPRA